ncbi:related to RGP1 Reduced growth phenotype [Lecanosticta acicola]|uniref:Related to RGP1 Reduced growth phenotype n=1 Tax=Lecanosticta acicola TaxID=111012 RepID=A0AAI8YXR4_9PEZI|nr:related to RGP1 Reduced growth phenotype [Lecanosticta acicola]
MPPPPPSSNIRAFVHWKEPTVHAGEDIECIITFKNIALPPGSRGEEEGTQPPASANGGGHGRRASYMPSATHSRRSSIAQVKPSALSRAASTASAKGGLPNRGHRPALSLNVVGAPARATSLQSAQLSQQHQQLGAGPNSAVRPSKSHGRSLSIMSLGSEPGSEGRPPATGPTTGKRTGRVHARSASLQHPPRLLGQSPALTMPSPRQPSPLCEATTSPALPEGQAMPLRPSRRRPGTVSADQTPQLGRNPSMRKPPATDTSDPGFNGFKFPAVEKTSPPNHESGRKLVRSPSNMHSGQKRSLSPRPLDGWSGASNLNPITRVMSETSNEGTPRTSSELYSMSNHSDETLTSELPLQQQFGRLIPKITHSRRPSRSPQNRRAEPETLMMAYVKTMGNFSLDASLVNAAPFEEVKRKGVQGGGGVVGVERSKRSSGLFGALSWGNIGESLGGLLGGDEMSSMAQMKASVGTKTIPILSTPQSLLFVDLKLGPGESRSYNYRFSLPRGMPPSHRGRAIKVSYHLSLGVQRPEGQVVKHVEIPFRVLGSYDARGDMLGHDLMSPYVLMQDAARTTTITLDQLSSGSFSKFASKRENRKQKSPKQGLEDFLRYTERLMETPKDSNGILLSPTSPASPDSLHQTLSRQGSLTEMQPTSIKESIDFAILRSNLVSKAGKGAESQSANRFNIARSGQPVAILTMLRPAYRLGESVTGIVDFTDRSPASDPSSQAPTYSVLVELESAEQVDPSLALRSSHSINRVTRKVHASVRENSLFARQVGFNLSVPSNAAPTFETTGVSLVWRLRIEFTTQRQVQGLGIGSDDSKEELFEETGSDERGTTSIAKERLSVDTFEIAVPLKVYGAVGIDSVGSASEPLLV